MRLQRELESMYVNGATVEEFQVIGASLYQEGYQVQGIEKYRYSACKTKEDLQNEGFDFSAEVIDSDLTSFGNSTDSYYAEMKRCFPECVEFATSLPSLESAYAMFGYQYKLRRFEGDLVNLKSGRFMCNDGLDDDLPIESFVGKLPRLTDAEGMFLCCRHLSTFAPWGRDSSGHIIDSGDEGVLLNGEYMFDSTVLDLVSVKRIAKWLPQRYERDESSSSGNYGWIHIGVASGVNSGDEYAAAIQEMTDKNWRVVICVNDEWDTVN